MQNNIISKLFSVKPGNSLLDKFPEIATEWHPTRNGALTPDNVTAGSDKSVWWQCAQGHEWETSVNQRIRTKGCKVCRRLNMLPSRSITECYPELITDWHPELNNGLDPSDVFCMSGKKVWWLCRNGHSWQAAPSGRSCGTGCPYCFRKRLRKERSFEHDSPSFAKEWHPVLNGIVTPSDISKRNKKSVWWMCGKGHEWKQSIISRIKKSKCPFCVIEESDNSFGKHFPELIHEWHTEKNGQLTPFNVTRQSNKLVWWKCVKGHEWETAVYSRSSSGCPYCRRSLITSERSLFYRAPDLAKQWHPQKNGDWTVHNTLYGSDRKIWWLCQCGHEWEAKIHNRMIHRKCPVCRSFPGQEASLTSSSAAAQVKDPPIKPANQVMIDAILSDDNSETLTETNIIEDAQNYKYIQIQSDNAFLLTCLICGIQFPSLSWHLKSSHQMNGDTYKERFNLPYDYSLQARHLTKIQLGSRAC